MLPVALVLLAGLGFWLATKQVFDFRRHAGDYSESVVSDATPLNRRLWRANAWLQMIVLPFASLACLFEAFELTFGK